MPYFTLKTQARSCAGFVSHIALISPRFLSFRQQDRQTVSFAGAVYTGILSFASGSVKNRYSLSWDGADSPEVI
jgi:hypothetical protein